MNLAAAVRSGLDMLSQGADALDIGGESTRPGSQGVPVVEQLARVCPLLSALRAEPDAPLSVDTMSPAVAEAALEAGADVINDVGGFRAAGWQEVLASTEAPVVVVHMQGEPRTMQEAPAYPDGVVSAVDGFFESRLAVLDGWGVARGRVLLDPGIGFGKRLEDNLELLRELGAFRALGCPLYVGVSRKRFIGAVLGREVHERDVGTVAANAAAIQAGAHVLRVHNVSFTRDLVRMLSTIEQGLVPESAD